MSVNGYQSTLHADKMYQASLVPTSLQTFCCLQYGKDFSFAYGESLGTRLYQATRVENSLFKKAYMLTTVSVESPCLYQKQRVAQTASTMGMTWKLVSYSDGCIMALPTG